MKKLYSIILTGVLLSSLGTCASKDNVPAEPTLKDAFADKFLIGCAINRWQAAGEDSIGQALAAKHFNTLVAENDMKSEKIAIAPGEWEWQYADRFVDFGQKNNMFIVGHTLVWHSQLAPWFPYDEKGEKLDSAAMVERMHDYINTVVTRYKGRVGGWDVVNEAILEDGSYRHTPFYDIIGPEYIPLAFQFAHEADADAELYINDYGMNEKGRRDKYVEIVNDLKNRGLRIDAIGMQGHMGMDYPDFDEFEESLEAFAGTGCKVMVTEFDMSALPTLSKSANIADLFNGSEELNPYPDGLPEEVSKEWNERMSAVMNLLVKHSDVVSRVNFWGVSDGDSWKNGFPVRGRKDYPLAFDRNHQLKPFLQEALDSIK